MKKNKNILYYNKEIYSKILKKRDKNWEFNPKNGLIIQK
jgi:hypothetical protein